jgi:hypothetical protein
LTASRAPGSGPKRSSFQFSFAISSRPCSRRSSDRRGRRLDRDSEGARELGEVRLLEVDRERLPVGVALILPQDPVAAVVDEQERRRQAVLSRRRELLDAVEEAPVPDYRERRLPERDRGPERSGPGVAERPRAERVEERTRAESREVRAGPVRQDGHVPAACGLRWERAAYRFEQAAFELSALLGEARGDPFPDGAGALLRAAVGLPLLQALL